MLNCVLHSLGCILRNETAGYTAILCLIFFSLKKFATCQVCTPLVTALGRQRQGNASKFEASLVYTESSRAARATQKSCLEKRKGREEGREKGSCYCF